MALYGAAKAPSVPKYSDGSTVDNLTEDGSAIGGTNDGDLPAAPAVNLAAWDGATSPTAAEATDISDAINDLSAMVREVADKVNDLLEHMNDGRG